MIHNGISAAPPGVNAPSAPRRRLPAATRVAQILDAALRVFSDKGFACARVDDIAEAAGLSKGGVYTHFASKEEIFGALLKRLIAPMPAAPKALTDDEPVTVDLLVRCVVEPMYASLGDPSVLQTVRLLLAEGLRASQAFEQWQQTLFEPHIADVARLLRRGVRQGTLRPSAVTREPRLILSPGMHAMLDGVVRGAAPNPLAHEAVSAARSHGVPAWTQMPSAKPGCLYSPSLQGGVSLRDGEAGAAIHFVRDDGGFIGH